MTSFVVIEEAMLRSFFDMLSLPHEMTGHIDFGADGRVERVRSEPGMTVADVSRDYEVSFHTHVRDFRNTFPNHPSPTDMKHIAHSIGAAREVHYHLIFCPEYIYAITVSEALRSRIASPGGLQRVYQQIDAAFEETSHGVNDARHTPAFRSRWVTALRQLGFILQTQGSNDGGFAAYKQPLRLSLTPIEPGFYSGTVRQVLLMAVALGLALALLAKK